MPGLNKSITMSYGFNARNQLRKLVIYGKQ